ncbi:MAG: hypothetical protein K2M60_00030 [Lachnospiraceae bacterium]|nr:hypothetical protein [Lachnospiraceae bacterium]MDE6252651.1 hypothetical protein [Lachnospiraceae bacterium]
MVRERYIRVPKNRQAMRDYDYGIQSSEQMQELILNDEQYSKLDKLGVFDKINEKCNIIIDDYEEEVLELSEIPIALDVINQLMENSKCEELAKLKWIFTQAISYGTIEGFDF